MSANRSCTRSRRNRHAARWPAHGRCRWSSAPIRSACAACRDIHPAGRRKRRGDRRRIRCRRWCREPATPGPDRAGGPPAPPLAERARQRRAHRSTPGADLGIGLLLPARDRGRRRRGRSDAAEPRAVIAGIEHAAGSQAGRPRAASRGRHGRAISTSGRTPWVGTRPRVGLRPATAQQAAGMRMLPPVSVPSAARREAGRERRAAAAARAADAERRATADGARREFARRKRRDRSP